MFVHDKETNALRLRDAHDGYPRGARYFTSGVFVTTGLSKSIRKF